MEETRVQEVDEYGRPADFCLGHEDSEILPLVEYISREFSRAQAEREEWLGEDCEPARVDDLVNADWVGKDGHDFIGVGCDRVVMGLCLEHVVKIDFDGLSSANELAVWEGANEELRELLCPIFGHGAHAGTKWLLAGRAWPMEEMEAPTSAKWDRLEGITDLRSENWGEYRGRQVIIDYGESYPEMVRLGIEAPNLS
jgi:hypothetical protein